jgi:glutaredoxin
MRNGAIRQVVLILVLLALPALAGEISKWKDASGRVHYGDTPPADVAAERLTVDPNVYESQAGERGFEPASAAIATPKPKKVVMYSTVRCGYCRKARAYFKANGIAFTDYDVETSDKGRQDYRRMGARGVPVILVGDKRMNGFSESAFASLYADGQ